MKTNLQIILSLFLCIGISSFAQVSSSSLSSASQNNPHSRIPAFFTFQENDRPAIAEFTNFLNRNYQIGDFSFQLLQKETDNIGFVHYRYIQLFKGIPIKGTMLIAHTKNGLVQSFNGETTTEINAISEASISSEAALNLAMKFVGATTYKWQLADEEAYIKKEQNDPKATFYPTAEKFIVDAGKSNYRLAYRFDIYAQEPVSRKYVFIDAQTGAVISSEDRIHETEVTGSAVTAYSGTQSIQTDNTGTTYRLRETSRGLGIETYNLAKGTTYTSAVDFTDADNIWNNVNANKDQYATDAHFGAEKTYDFFQTKFNRNSIDNAGFKLISYVHYSSNYVNAYWDGTRMTYGDGNATYSPLTSMDISGHEITHGLTEKTAALVYSYQSGALNESFSDIFGTAIEFYATPSIADWLIGEDIGAPFRSMSNPNANSQPDTYLGTYWYTGTGDNGGVHYNSGVQNYWFYLLSVGGSGTNDIGNAFSVSGIGIDKAAAIAYRCLTTYLTSTAQYADARTYSIQAATDLYGACSPEVIATTAAWYAVGVGSNSLTANPTISFNGSSTFCSGSSLTLNANTLSNYQWNLNGQAIVGATNSSYVASTAGSYSLSTLLCGNTFTSSPVVITLTSASVSLSASATNSCQPVTLTANASPGYAIQWLKDGVVISGATASTYTASTSGNYSARISSTVGPAVTLTNTTTASIPDNSCTGAFTSITASGLPSSVSSTGINIKVNITHPWVGDLKLFLEAPNGDLLGLANAVGSSGDNFTNTIFSDAGSAQIPSTGAPYTGTYKPWQTVFTTCTSTMTKTSFAGLGNGSINANGIWKLRVIDAGAADLGTINNWSITFPQTITPSPDCGPITSSPIAINIGTGSGINAGITASGPTTFCQGENVTLTATGGTTFTWSTGATTASIVASTSGTYSVTVGDGTGCTGNANTSVSVTAASTWYLDADTDGFGSSNSILSCSQPDGYVSNSSDCNDNNVNINTPINYYVDADADGVGSSTTASLCSVTAPAGYSTATGDCNDNNANIQSPINYYVDADGDGVGSSTTASLCSVTAPAGYSSTTGDCNDNNANIQSPINYYVDADGDGVGSATTASLCSVTAPAGYSSTTGDCNDNNASIQSPIIYYADADGDGVGSATTASLCSVTAPAGYSTTTGDCNDNNSAIKPSALEICGNGIDDNCNGSSDEGCTAYTYYLDTDNDGFGNALTSITSFSASTPAGYSTLNTDCNDNNAAIKPSAAEICGNGIDDNCNGVIDENGTALTAISSINGPVGVCKSQTGVVFSVSAISGATTYTWTVPTGATITAGQGTTSLTVSFSATQAAGNICVKASNACVTTAQYCRSLTIYTVKPATPVAILGSNIEICPGSTKTFSVAAVANATTYTWTAPTNASVLSGQGTTTVTVSFSAAFVSGSMSVTAGNCIGTSTARTLTLYNKPATPSSITGASVGLCAGASGTYTCTAMTGATSYLWTVPAGWIINSGQGTTSVNITPATYTSAAITVSAVSACGASTAKSLTIRSTPATPGTITGTTTNVCSAGPYTYSIAAVTGATSYIWTVPTGCTILTNSGTSITMGTSSGFTAAGNVTVKSSNGCGASVAKTLAISPIPTQPAVITGISAVCASQQGVTYSTTAVAGMTYVWTVPTGATIFSGQGNNSIVVNFGTSVGSITVKASNGCALSTARSLTVTQLACRMADEETIETIQEPNFDIFPNPGHGTYTLRLNNIESSAKANIYSMTGQLIQQINIPVGTMEIPVNLNDAAEGIYLLRIENDTFVKELKVIKN